MELLDRLALLERLTLLGRLVLLERLALLRRLALLERMLLLVKLPLLGRPMRLEAQTMLEMLRARKALDVMIVLCELTLSAIGIPTVPQ